VVGVAAPAAALALGVALVRPTAGTGFLASLAAVATPLLAAAAPWVLRRAQPALGVALAGVEPTRALVFSQVVLSFGIPFALIPLVLFTSKREVMGGLVNNRLTSSAAWVIAVVISGLNVFLLGETFL
jgi:manganese transport protein